MKTEEQIRVDIAEQFRWDSRIDDTNLNVDVRGGRVLLSGVVGSVWERDAAIEGVRAVAGDMPIEDNLKTKDDEQEAPANAGELVSAVKNALAYGSDVDGSNIKVSAHEGVVTLTGSVPLHWQKSRAEDIALALKNVYEVRNLLAVVPAGDLPDQVIAEAIEGALARNRQIDPSDVDIQVENGRVRLEGTVPSWSAHAAVYQAARYTPGVREVDDHLVVPRTVA